MSNETKSTDAMREVAAELRAIRHQLDRLYDLLYEHFNPSEVEDLGVIREGDQAGQRPPGSSPLRLVPPKEG